MYSPADCKSVRAGFDHLILFTYAPSVQNGKGLGMADHLASVYSGKALLDGSHLPFLHVHKLFDGLSSKKRF